MAAPEVEAVLEFLRKNGFLKAEIALREDLVDKAQLGAFHLDKFVFPMVPPPPPVRISSRPEDAGDEGPTSGASSHDQFMSLGSSTSDVSSDFVNPYGLRSSSTPNSNASSDRMSQFGTARAYNDFDFEMQNDLYSYDEKSDDGNFMTPCFRGPEPSPGHAEDKFVMPSDKKVTDNLNRLSTKEEHEIEEPNGFTLERKDKSLLGERMDSTDNNWSLYDVCLKETDLNDLETENLGDICMPEEYVSLEKDPSRRNFDSCKIRYSGEDWFNGSKPNLVSEENPPTKDFTSTEELGASAKDQEGVSRDEILMVESLEEEENEVFELRIVHRKNRTGFEEYKDFPIVLNTIIVGRYYVTEYLGSAAFSKVVQALDLHTGTNVCLKIIKNDKDFLDQSLDEIKLLKLVNRHDPADEHHILRLYDYFYHQEHLFIVCELLRANLYEFQKFNQETGEESYFTLSRLQIISRQCLEALEYLHNNLGIIHCDLKPENILIKNYRRTEIKIIDFGSSCFRCDNLCLYVQSRSYRAPEVILGLPYNEKIDIWSLGCILAELCSGEVLFPNEPVVMILAHMIGILGPIDLKMLLRGQETAKYFTAEYDIYYMNEETEQLEYIIPEESSLESRLRVSDDGFINFVRSLLEMNPDRRPTAREALDHPWMSHEYSSSC